MKIGYLIKNNNSERFELQNSDYEIIETFTSGNKIEVRDEETLEFRSGKVEFDHKLNSYIFINNEEKFKLKNMMVARVK